MNVEILNYIVNQCSSMIFYLLKCRSSIRENKGKDFDEHAKRLGRLFGRGTDNKDIALHALDIEKRAVKEKLKKEADEEEERR